MSQSSDRLVVVQTRTGQTVREVALAGDLTIGRQAGNGLQLEDLEVSRNQARVFREDGRWYLADVGSRNGTQVDGKRLGSLERAPLRDGSLARIGPFELRFQLTEAAAGDKTAPLGAPPPVEAAPAWIAPVEPPPPPSPLMSHLLDPRTRIPVWSEGEIALRVADIVEETADTKTFRLVGESPVLFSFKPGQFITLELEIDGQKVRRSYTISSSPSRPHALEITVKRCPGGVVSNFLNEHAQLGQLIRARGPSGKFSCFNYPSRKILAIAGGSGITPVMSMARWIVDTAADVDFTLVYSSRSPQDMIFRKELEWMSSRHSGFRVLATVTSRWHGTDAWTGCTSRVDGGLLRLAAPDLEERHTFLCGPPPFMEAVKDALAGIDFPGANLHTESFGAGRVAKGAAPAKASAAPAPTPIAVAAAVAAVAAPGAEQVPVAPPEPAAAGWTVAFKSAGKSARADGSTPLLELAEQSGVEIEYGCRSGSCGSCRVRCAPAEVDMPDECALDAAERAEGWVLACVAHPKASLEVLA